MKALCLVASLVATNALAAAPDRSWHWDSPSPQANDLHAIWGSSLQNIYIVGDAGTILHSTDGAASWKTRFLDREVDLVSIWGSGPNDVYVGGHTATYQGVLFHSTDQGESWQRTELERDIAGIFGTGPNDVYLVGSAGAILHSSDAGKSWQKQETKTTNYFLGIWGSASGLFVVGGGSQGELLSLRKGLWGAETLSLAENLHSVKGDAAGNLYAVGNGGTIVTSPNNGKTWKLQKSTVTQNLYEVWCLSKGEALAVGEDNLLLQTKDAGKTWSRIPMESEDKGGSDLNAIWGMDGKLFIAGEGGAILLSTDQGKTWERHQIATPALTKVFGVSPNDIYAVGYGAILHGDGKERWATLKTNTDIEFVSVWGSGPKDVYLLGAFGELWHSVDGGDTWKVTQVQTNGRAAQIWGSSADNVYIIGAGGLLLHSQDRGESWKRKETGTEHHFASIWGTGSNLYIVGDYGIILRSTDNGKTFTSQRLWEPKDGVAAKGFVSVKGTKKGEVFAVGYCDGCLLYSKDAGKSWQLKEMKIQEGFHSLWVEGERVFVLGDFGNLYELSKDRSRWELVSLPTNMNLGDLWGDGKGSLYTVGYHGAVLHGRP